MRYIIYLCRKDIIMDATLKPKRKVIDLPEDVFRYLSIKAAAEGKNLKNYIECLLARDVEDMDDSETYRYLCETRPGGKVLLNEGEQEKFEEWLGIEK